MPRSLPGDPPMDVRVPYPVAPPFPHRPQLNSAPSAPKVKMMSCFRAVAQNDAERLAELLTDVPIEVWSVWQNKARSPGVGAHRAPP